MATACRSTSSGCARPIPTGSALRLHGRESIGSWFEQALVARRQQHFAFRAEAEVSFAPDNFQQMAGITHYYNRHKFHFMGLTWHAELGRVLTILSCPGDWPDCKLEFPLAAPLPVPGDRPVGLAIEVDHDRLQFHCRTDADWTQIGPPLDASIISDEAGRGEHASFTGAFVGMVAFDTSGAAQAADFFRFSYKPG